MTSRLKMSRIAIAVLLIPRELPAAPMMLFMIGIKHPLDVAVQCPHDTDTCEHRWSSERRHQDQGFHGRLPLRGLMIGLRERCDVSAGILERDELTAARELDRIIKRSFPAPGANGANPFTNS
jgi:hypothetical protein